MDSNYQKEDFEYDKKHSQDVIDFCYGKKIELLKHLSNLLNMGIKIWLSIMTENTVIYDEINHDAMFLLRKIDYYSIKHISYDEGEAMVTIDIIVN